MKEYITVENVMNGTYNKSAIFCNQYIASTYHSC